MHAQADCRAMRAARVEGLTRQTIALDSPRRSETENFIRGVFANRYAARVNSFATDLMLLEQIFRAHCGSRRLAQCGQRPVVSGNLS